MTNHKIKNLEDVLVPAIKKYNFIGAFVSKLTSAGDNYASLILAIDITVKDGEEVKTIPTVAKLLPRNLYIQKHFNSQYSYRNEVGYYQTIFPCLRQFQEEKGMKNLIDFIPDFYGARFNLNTSSGKIDEDAILIIKNVKIDGFTTTNRKIGFDLDQSKLILQKLSQLHATSIALKLQKPEIFNAKIDPFLEEFICFDVGEADATRSSESFIDLLKGDEVCMKKLTAIRDILTTNRNIVIRRNNKSLKINQYTTLTHGDLWINNILLKTINGKTTDVKFVDFQMYEFTSLAKDILLFVYTSVQTAVLEKHSNDLLAFYYDSFINNLRGLGCDVSQYNIEDFLRELGSILRRTELFHILLMLKVVYAEEKSVKEMEEMSKEDFVRHVKASKDCKEKACFIVREFIRRGWI